MWKKREHWIELQYSLIGLSYGKIYRTVFALFAKQMYSISYYVTTKFSYLVIKI